jgi:hypothetical protein
MTIDRLDASQQNGIQTQNQASHTTVLITDAEVALGTAAATGVRRKERRWVALLRRIVVTAPKESRRKRRPFRDMAYLEQSRMRRELERL